MARVSLVVRITLLWLVWLVAAVNLAMGTNNGCVWVGSGGANCVSTTSSVFLGRDATGTNNTNQVALGFNAQATMDNEMVLG